MAQSRRSSGRLPRVSGARVVAVLERGGFRVSRVRGSHYYLRKADVALPVIVPVHGNRDLPLGTLRAVLRQAGLSADDLSELLRS